MALSPPLLPGGIPLGIVGEVFCLERNGITLSLTAGGMRVNENGRLYLTTLRMCFVPDAPSSVAVDLPFLGISDENFVQPIFGANRLEYTIAPVPGRGLPGPARVSLKFRHGGCGTFLHFFFRIMETYKRSAAEQAARLSSSGPSILAPAWVGQQQAFVDASDPSRIFVVQPAPPPHAAPPAYAPATASGSGPRPGASISEDPSPPYYAPPPRGA